MNKFYDLQMLDIVLSAHEVIDPKSTINNEIKK